MSSRATVTVEDYIETASLHVVPTYCRTRFFFLQVLEYLRDKPATPRRLGAFSFVVSALQPDDFYREDGTQEHFLNKNRHYGPTYLAFGGDPNSGVTAPHSVLRVKNLRFHTSHRPAPQRLTHDVVAYYGASLPFYDIALPTVEQFEWQDISALHRFYVQAGVGVRMTHDTLGKVTSERIHDILFYLNNARWLAPSVHLLSHIKQLSLTCKCDEDLLVIVADLSNDAYFKELVAVYGSHFRLFMLSDDMFRQVMALPAHYPVATDDERRPFVLEAMNHVGALVERARLLNSQTLCKVKLDHPDKLVYAMSVHTPNILDIPPCEFSCAVDNERIVIDYTSEPLPTCLAPGYSVGELFKSVVKPKLYYFLEDKNADDTLYDPDNEIVHALNTCR